MWRAALVESIATAFLLFFIICSSIAFLETNISAPLLLVPFGVFINLLLFLMAMMPITGGHMNTFVTFIAFLQGITPLVRAGVYISAQTLGSILGFLLIELVLSPDLAHKTLLGGCALNELKLETAFVLEFTRTFLVLLVGITVAFDAKRRKELGLTMVCAFVSAPMAVGVFVSITVTGKVGYAGVGLNPARCLGPAVFEGGLLCYTQWAFWVGPFLACVVYHLLFKSFPKEGLEILA